MAGHGPPPKTEATRRRRNPSPEVRSVAADGRRRGPALPKAWDIFEYGEEWHPQTVKWWDTWRKSAQAQEFTDTDWDFLLDTALMHHTMWSKGRWEFASELRLRVAKYGATPEDRLRLRLEVAPKGSKPESAKTVSSVPDGGNVTDIRSRRGRLTG